MFVEGGYASVDLFFGDDEGWGDYEVGDPGLDGDSISEHLCGDLVDYECFAGDFVGVGVEGFFGGAVFDHVDGPEESFAADVAYADVFGFEVVEFGFDVRG